MRFFAERKRQASSKLLFHLLAMLLVFRHYVNFV